MSVFHVFGSFTGEFPSVGWCVIAWNQPASMVVKKSPAPVTRAGSTGVASCGFDADDADVQFTCERMDPVSDAPYGCGDVPRG